MGQAVGQGYTSPQLCIWFAVIFFEIQTGGGKPDAKVLKVGGYVEGLSKCLYLVVLPDDLGHIAGVNPFKHKFYWLKSSAFRLALL